MKLLIQHTHQSGEIAGVLTYIDAIVPALNSHAIQTEVISTKDSIFTWLQAILKADLIHMNSNHLGFAVLCKLLNKKIIIKYHYLFYSSTHNYYEKMSLKQRLRTEFIQTLPKSNYPLKWKLFTVVKWARLGVRFATALLSDRHVACSQFLAESLSFPWRVETLYNPIALSKSEKILSKPYTFVYAGRLNPDKGIDLLIRAVKRLNNANFKVLIIGEGNELETLQTLAIQLSLSDRIEFLGRRSSSETLEIMRAALAVIVPSRWQEPAGYVALEAASVGTCPIVSNVGGLPEMAGTSCLFFERENVQELAERMQFCLDNPAEILDRGHQANKYVSEKFSPEAISSQLIKLCQELKPGL